jgi:diguanylate cyclase (GGDEF)-like protein
MFLNKNKQYYLVFTFLVIFLLTFLYFYKNINSYEERLKDFLLNRSIELVDNTSDNILEEILEENVDFVEINRRNSEVRLKNEKSLSILRNNDIQDLYIVYPSEGKLFFLLDTAEKDRGELDELFTPENPYLFKKVFETGQKNTHIQNGIENIGFTLIKPIIQDKNVVAYLVVDYTKECLFSLSKLLTLSASSIHLVIVILFAFLIFIIYYLFYRNYVKYKIYYNEDTNTLKRIYLSENYEKIEFEKYYVALADLDFFKRINTLYGRKNGDILINSVIKTINVLLKKEDMFIEYSGESFLLFILKAKTSEKEFKELMDTICLHIERKSFRLPHKRVKLTISIGAVIETELEKSLEDVIHKADTALYETKRHGRNCVVYFDMTHSQKLYRKKLKELIESDKLICHYQPIVNLHDHSIHHYEALLRIEDGSSIIFPDKILPDLEDSHLYSYLSKRVIIFNVKKLRENPLMQISINLSADDLLNETILSLLAENADLADRLQIEILENKSIDYSRVEYSIQKLKIFGYKIAIDDFGAGYANMGHLLNLSLDFLKIDGSLVKDIHKNKPVYTLIKSLSDFCQSNNIKVIAEFVENEEIAEVLKEIGISYGQGWYFAKALPYEELEFKL